MLSSDSVVSVSGNSDEMELVAGEKSGDDTSLMSSMTSVASAASVISLGETETTVVLFNGCMSAKLVSGEDSGCLLSFDSIIVVIIIMT